MGLDRSYVPVTLASRDGGPSHTLQCHVRLRTALPAAYRGLHVSRLGDVVAELTTRAFADLLDCARVCAAAVLQMTNGRVQVNANSPFGCLGCGHCMMSCPTGSVTVTGRDIDPRNLDALPAPQDRANAAALDALMKSRRSVRLFADKEVAQEDLDHIVATASTAPMGIPPWDVGVVTLRGRGKVRDLAAEIIKGYEGFLKLFRPWVLNVMRPFIGRARYELYADFVVPLAQTYVDYWRNGRDVLFYDAPALIVFHHSPYADAVDASIACTYAMLSAESLGLGTTWIGGAPPVLQRNKTLCRSLGIPEKNCASAALIVGWPDVRFLKTVRRGFTSVNRIA